MKKFKNARSKPKRIYKKNTIKKFPSNYRFIPDLNSDGFAFIVGLLFITASVFVLSLDLYKNLTEKNLLEYEKDKKEKELSFWQKEIGEKPKFRDGYFKLAIIYYQLKDFDKSSKYLEKVIELDPNFKKGEELRNLLENY